MSYGCRDLRRRDWDTIKRFLDQAPPYATVLMRGPARDIEAFSGWWFGALEDGTKLEALACVEGTATSIYGDNPYAIEAMATEMLRRSQAPSSGGAHQLLGSKQVIDTFWSIFRETSRPVIFDKQRKLYGSTDPAAPPKPALAVTAAARSDLKLVYEFSGEQAVDQWGFDPRRASPKAHEERCLAAIAEGRQLIGRDRGKPVFITEVVEPDPDTAILDRVFLPRPFRIRRKLVTSALVLAARHALQQAKEVLLFVDADDELLERAASQAGFEMRHPFRLIVMRA